MAVKPDDTDLDPQNLPNLWQKIDKYFGNDSEKGQFDIANAIRPTGRVVFHPNFTNFARQLKQKRIPATGFGGFCPSGGNQVSGTNGWVDG